MITKKRAAFVVNPAKCTDIDAIKKVAAAISGWDAPLYLETTIDDPGAGSAREALAAEVDLVVICGGDGTVTACMGSLAGAGVPVAIVPCGTGNLLARNLGIPLDVAGAVEVAFTGRDRPIDLGMLDAEPFAVMAGIGFDAAMLDDTNDRLKSRVGWLAYVVGAIRHLRDPRFRVALHPADGPVVSRRSVGVLIGNVGHLQGNLPLMPDAEPDDGLLDVLVMAPRGWIGWLRLTLAVLARRREGPTFERLRVRELEIVADRPVACERDGEVVESRSQMHIGVAALAIIVRCPNPTL
jgi:YegS/Rv2252/BmrU family lipid kinase